MMNTTYKKFSSFRYSHLEYPTLAIAIVAVLYGVVPRVVHAADIGAAAEDDLEELIVTGTRRKQSVVDVPFNISAVSGDQIDAQNLSNPVDLLRTVPGVSVVDRGVRNSGVVNNIRIRGVNVDAATLGDYAVAGTAAVTTYVGDTPIFANFLLKDIERVEVLRGPQGTLYGRGSLGGTVRYILRDPVMGQTSGEAAAGISKTTGSDGMNWNADVTVNLSAGERFALRGNFSHVDDAGVVDYVNLYQLDGNGIPKAPNGVLNSAASYTSKKDADFYTIDYGRLAVAWKLADSSQLVLNLVQQKDKTGGRRQIVQPGTVNNANGGVYGDYENGAVLLEPSARDASMASLEGTFDLGFASLTSSTSYTDHSGTSTTDNSGLYGKNWPFLYYSYPRLMAQKYRDYSDRAFAQELRLVSNTDKENKIDYIAGLYYEDEKLHSGETDWVRGFTQWWTAQDAAAPGSVSYYDPVAPTSDRDFLYKRNEGFTEVAAFGELTFNITPSMHLTAGVRYFSDKDSNSVSVVPDLPTRYSESAPVVPEQDKSKSIYKFNYAWRFTNHDNLYLTASQGYRRGGVNDIPTTGVVGENPGWVNFGPDSLNNYELGVKGARGSFSYNVSVFRIDWKDIQLNTQTPIWGYYVTVNAGKARSQGIELELQVTAGDAFHYGFGYAYADANLVEDAHRPYSPFKVIAPKDRQLPAAPKNVINASLDYTIHISKSLTLVPHLDAYHQSETFNYLATTDATSIQLDAYTLLNASIALSAEKWSSTLYCKNLGNSKAISGMFPESTFGSAPADGFAGNDMRLLIANPRTIGLSLKYKF